MPFALSSATICIELFIFLLTYLLIYIPLREPYSTHLSSSTCVHPLYTTLVTLATESMQSNTDIPALMLPPSHNHAPCKGAGVQSLHCHLDDDSDPVATPVPGVESNTDRVRPTYPKGSNAISPLGASQI